MSIISASASLSLSLVRLRSRMDMGTWSILGSEQVLSFSDEKGGWDVDVE